MKRSEYDALVDLERNLTDLSHEWCDRARVRPEHSEAYGYARGIQDAYADVANYLYEALRGVVID